jgi:hypothetical protein
MKLIGRWLFSMLLLSSATGFAQKKDLAREMYELRIYHYSNATQEKRLLTFLETAMLPAMHKHGVKDVGVFEAWANDTATDKKIYVLVPYESLQQKATVETKILTDPTFITEGSDYIEATYDKPVYDRFETIFIQAWKMAPKLQKPALSGAREKRVYELRSYESASEKIYRSKVHMFNEGGEIDLFKRLNFNAIFYGDVLAGPVMPNLMYMTSFDNMESRDARWKTFVDSPEWKALVVMPEYQHNISKMTITFLRPLEFSDY